MQTFLKMSSAVRGGSAHRTNTALVLSGNRSGSPARRSSPKPKADAKAEVTLELLQDSYEELVSFKHEDEKQKKEEAKRKTLKVQNDTKCVNRMYQQAQKTVVARQKEVDKLMRKLEKVGAETEKQTAKKTYHHEKLHVMLKKLRAEENHTAAVLQEKISEVNTANGRLHHIDWVLEHMDEQALERTAEKVDSLSKVMMPSDEQVVRRESLCKDVEEVRGRNAMIREENEKMQRTLEELRLAIKERQEALVKEEAMEQFKEDAFLQTQLDAMAWAKQSDQDVIALAKQGAFGRSNHEALQTHNDVGLAKHTRSNLEALQIHYDMGLAKHALSNHDALQTQEAIALAKQGVVSHDALVPPKHRASPRDKEGHGLQTQGAVALGKQGILSHDALVSSKRRASPSDTEGQDVTRAHAAVPERASSANRISEAGKRVLEAAQSVLQGSSRDPSMITQDVSTHFSPSSMSDFGWTSPESGPSGAQSCARGFSPAGGSQAGSAPCLASSLSASGPKTPATGGASSSPMPPLRQSSAQATPSGHAAVSHFGFASGHGSGSPNVGSACHNVANPCWSCAHPGPVPSGAAVHGSANLGSVGQAVANRGASYVPSGVAMSCGASSGSATGANDVPSYVFPPPVTLGTSRSSTHLDGMGPCHAQSRCLTPPHVRMQSASPCLQAVSPVGTVGTACAVRVEQPQVYRSNSPSAGVCLQPGHKRLSASVPHISIVSGSRSATPIRSGTPGGSVEVPAYACQAPRASPAALPRIAIKESRSVPPLPRTLSARFIPGEARSSLVVPTLQRSASTGAATREQQAHSTYFRTASLQNHPTHGSEPPTF